MNINTNISNDDPGRPAAFINTVYEALKADLPRTQQVRQQGPNAGLAWLGAEAAHRYQQHAMNQQKAQESAQFGQNPQPTIAQQLQMAAMQGGIMGQLPNNMQMAQQPPAPQGTMGLGDLPVDPNTLPQEGMAGGGLVALAQGGYLDADGSGSYEPVGESYASGGQVRGFEGGGSVWDFIKSLPEETYNLNQYYGQKLADSAEGVFSRLKEAPERWKQRISEAEKEAEEQGASNPIEHIIDDIKDVSKPAHKVKVEGEAANTAPVFKKSLLDSNHLAVLDEPVSLDPKLDYGRGVTKMVSQEGARDSEDAEQIQEARDIRQADEAAQGGLPAIQAQQPQQQSASSVEDQLAKILALRGGAPANMSPEERAWRQEQVESANKEKWLQALTAMAGGVFAGGGRNWPEAIGQGALYGLSAYRQGAAAESEAELGLLNRNAQVQEAQRKAQEEAADKLLAIQIKKMELRNAADIAEERADLRRELDAAKADRSAAYAGAATDAQKLTAWNQASERARKELEETYTSKLEPIPPGKLEELTTRYYQAALMGTGVGLSLGGGAGIAGGQGLGGGRPIGRITSAGGFQ